MKRPVSQTYSLDAGLTFTDRVCSLLLISIINACPGIHKANQILHFYVFNALHDQCKASTRKNKLEEFFLYLVWPRRVRGVVYHHALFLLKLIGLMLRKSKLHSNWIQTSAKNSYTLINFKIYQYFEIVFWI